LVQIGTKQLPKMVEGLSAFQRQAAKIAESKIPSPSEFIGPMPLIGPMPSTSMPKVETPDIQIAPLEGAKSAIMDARAEMNRLVEAGKSRFPQGGVLSYGDEIERAMRRARESAASGSAAVADAIQLGAAGVTESTKKIETSITSVAPAMKTVSNSVATTGGSITASLRSLGAFASTLPDRFKAIGPAIASTFASARTSTTSAMAGIVDAIKRLPTTVSGSFSAIATGFRSIPAAGASAFSAIGASAMRFDAVLTGVAGRAVVAGRAIGAALYMALGPIGLILAAAAVLYAVIDKFVTDAEARVAESNARIEAATARNNEAIASTIDEIKKLRTERERADAKSQGITADIEGLQALLAARGDGIRFTEEQIARERELRDEIEANASAQKAVQQAAEERARAEKTLKAAQGRIDSMNGQQVEDAVLNEAVTNLRNAEAMVNAQKAQEAEARKLADATAATLDLERQRLDLVSAVAAQRRLEAEQEKQKEAIASVLQGIEDERLKITMEASDYEQMILDRRLKQAGVTDPAAFARVKAAQDALDAAKSAAAFANEQESLERDIAAASMSKAEAERAAYEQKIAGLNISERERDLLLERFSILQAEREAAQNRTAIDAIAGDLAKREADLAATSLELTIGKAAAEAQLLETRMRSLGASEDEIRATMDRLAVIQDQEKAIKDAQKAEEERQKMVERAAQLEKDIAAATESARTKAMEDDLKRQQITETLSTAIGGITVAGATDAIDIDKRVYDETKKQTDELRKINQALSSSGVAVLT
jgi:hypothetical protein